MKKKKFLKILGIVFSIILSIVLIYFISIHYNGFLNKNNTMNRAEIIELLEKGKEYPNYYCSPQYSIIFWNLDEEKTEYYLKDNIEKYVNNGNLLSWTNYNNDENIMVWEMNNGKKFAGISSLENYIENENSQRGFDYSLISKEDVFNTNFEYMGERKYKERNTILVKVWNKDRLKVNSTIFYIDKDTGLIMRRIDYEALGFIKIDCNRNVKLDIVNDDDIQRPNLENYEILQSK